MHVSKTRLSTKTRARLPTPAASLRSPFCPSHSLTTTQRKSVFRVLTRHLLIKLEIDYTTRCFRCQLTRLDPDPQNSEEFMRI